jgi:hypothetical protein
MIFVETSKTAETYKQKTIKQKQNTNVDKVFAYAMLGVLLHFPSFNFATRTQLVWQLL